MPERAGRGPDRAAGDIVIGAARKRGIAAAHLEAAMEGMVVEALPRYRAHRAAAQHSRGAQETGTGGGRALRGQQAAEEEKLCPLCIEPLDATEQQFLPCSCGYQLCLFCFDRIKSECSNLCPGCRTEYGTEKDRLQKAEARRRAGSGGAAREPSASPPANPGAGPDPEALALTREVQAAVNGRRMGAREGAARLADFLRRKESNLQARLAAAARPRAQQPQEPLQPAAAAMPQWVAPPSAGAAAVSQM
ncbi:hypothetical protein WJX81_002505 [Elliptochloris bilobata]|uniref:RING-type domain-containing protein n=1 Tax=Elliptochloris bilobata TaxID=381761 RepID=A0AAW1QMB1_9CHLO